MPNRLWKKIETGSILSDIPYHLDSGDSCYYAMDYISGGGWRASDENNIINNLKKPVSTKGTYQWQHKEKAITRFALDLARPLPQGSVIIPLPTSKVPTDPEYDDRLVRVAYETVKFGKSIRVETPIGINATMAAAHVGGTRRTADILANLVWYGFHGPVPDRVFFIDDVVTTGAHFKACCQLLKQHHPSIGIGGLFWAKTMWQKPDGSEFEEAEDTAPGRD